MTSHFDILHLPAMPVPFPLVSTQPGPSANDESDDLEDLIDETGATVHRSTDEAGSEMEAEPDPKPKPSLDGRLVGDDTCRGRFQVLCAAAHAVEGVCASKQRATSRLRSSR